MQALETDPCDSRFVCFAALPTMSPALYVLLGIVPRPSRCVQEQRHEYPCVQQAMLISLESGASDTLS